MSESVKNLSQDEIAKLDEIRQSFALKNHEIGQLEITITLANRQKEKMIEEYDKLRDDEVAFLKSLEESYGKGYLNVEEKTYHIS